MDVEPKGEVGRWEVPEYETVVFFARRAKYCLVIPVLNEGERIRATLRKLSRFAGEIDIMILDGGSTDGSLASDFLKEVGVRAVLTKKGPGKLSAQLRMGYSFALTEGYEGIVTIDGNDKDDASTLPEFMRLLDEGYDFVQASRYIKGGKGLNTPLVRDLAIRLMHAPVISLLSGFHYTDTTQGYRAYSRRMLLDERVAPFRSVFLGYELLAYLSVRIPELGYRVIETPVTREYPQGEKVPTKISFIRGNFALLKILWDLARHRYDPGA